MRRLAAAARPRRSLTAARAPAASQFYGASSFNADLSKWDVAKGTDFYQMVRAARPRAAASPQSSSPARPLAPRRSLTAARAPAASQFYGANSFNADLSEWNVTKGSNVDYMVRVARPRSSAAAPVATAHTDSPRPFRL